MESGYSITLRLGSKILKLPQGKTNMMGIEKGVLMSVASLKEI
jgi:hypothetical protein